MMEYDDMKRELIDRHGLVGFGVYLYASKHDIQSPQDVVDWAKGEVSIDFVRQVFATCYEVGLAVDESLEVH